MCVCVIYRKKTQSLLGVSYGRHIKGLGFIEGIMKDFLTYITEFDENKDLEFFNKRIAGAKKISAQAEKKGGPAILTYWHFAAKNSQYKEVLSAVQFGKNKEYFVSKYESIIDQLKTPNMTQKQFQVLSGRLEGWGEAIAKLFHN